MLTPNQYIESLYLEQGFKVVCTSVELDLSYSAVEGKDLEGVFRLINCTNPKDLLIVEGLQFLNFYAEHVEATTFGQARERSPTGVVDFFFFSKGSDVAQGLLQSFAAQFSKGA